MKSLMVRKIKNIDTFYCNIDDLKNCYLYRDVEYKDGKISKAYAYGLYFTNRVDNPQNVGSSGKHQRGHGRCVRLVRVVE